MNKNNAILEQFDLEIVASTQIPYCQIQNPPNLPLSQIEKLSPPWGWFIPSDQALTAEFHATNDWQPTRLTFGEDTKEARHVDGFLARKIKVVVLHKSNIEVQSKAKNGWRYCGLAYHSGQLTPEGELALNDRVNYRLRTRYLLFFLNDKKELLHPKPIKLGMNAGVGAAFSTELLEFRKEIETVFFSQRNEPQQQLSSLAHSLTIFNMELGLHKSEGKSPFIYPQKRLTPDESSQITRRERQIQLLHQPIDELIIPKKSDTGKIILDTWEQHKNFANLYRDDLAKYLNKINCIFCTKVY